jgi:hypothetical protein
MIQRIQTVFLLLALVALGLFLWLPLLRLEAPHFPAHEFKGYEVYIRYNGKIGFLSGYLYFINAILAGTAAGLTLISIFLYKNRSLQMLFCWFAILFIVSAQAFVYYEYHTQVFLGDVILRKWNLFSLIAVIAEILAIVYIRRDEETIKSLDRLR